MIDKNIQLAQNLINKIEQHVKIVFVTGSSVYKSNEEAKEDTDVDMFIAAKSKSIVPINRKLNKYLRYNNQANSEEAINYFKTGKTNTIPFFLKYKKTPVDFIIYELDFVKEFLDNLKNHYAREYRKRDLNKQKENQRFLIGTNGNTIENTFTKKIEDKIKEFPINLTINNVYYAYVPLTNILGERCFIKGKEKFNQYYGLFKRKLSANYPNNRLLNLQYSKDK